MRFLKESANLIELYTLQHKSVLETLLSGKTYIANYNNIFSSEYKEQYKRLSELIGFNNCPIFCATKYSKDIIASSNIKSSDKVLLKLKVPVDCIKQHQYYDWSDYLYYETSEPWENSSISKEDLENSFKNQEVYDRDSIQVVIDRIEPSWLIK